MKFYSRILGDCDYSLFEVLHFGLRLPGVLSSFGDVKPASVSNWSTIKSGKSAAALAPGERITNRSALELFNQRGQLKRPATLREEALSGISFDAFSRLYDVVSGSIVQKRKEKFVALTGAGWPGQAKRSHAQHEDYAKKTLYAYMPCPGLAGTEYVDAAVREYYGSYARALADFVADRNNRWCPKWVRRNYEIQNKEAANAVLPKDASMGHELPALPEKETSGDPEKFPHESVYKKNEVRFRTCWRAARRGRRRKTRGILHRPSLGERKPRALATPQ